jgi:hypothetical protein
MKLLIDIEFWYVVSMPYILYDFSLCSMFFCLLFTVVWVEVVASSNLNTPSDASKIFLFPPFIKSFFRLSKSKLSIINKNFRKNYLPIWSIDLSFFCLVNFYVSYICENWLKFNSSSAAVVLELLRVDNIYLF